MGVFVFGLHTKRKMILDETKIGHRMKDIGLNRLIIIIIINEISPFFISLKDLIIYHIHNFYMGKMIRCCRCHALFFLSYLMTFSKFKILILSILITTIN